MHRCIALVLLHGLEACHGLDLEDDAQRDDSIGFADGVMGRSYSSLSASLPSDSDSASATRGSSGAVGTGAGGVASSSSAMGRSLSARS